MPWLSLLLGVAALLGLLGLLFLAHRRVIAARSSWGEWPDDARDLKAIARYGQVRAMADGIRTLDARTWDDLTMDDVFRYLDRAESLVGQQTLYARLRTCPWGDHLNDFEDLVSGFGTDEQARRAADRALRGMRRVDACDIRWLTEPGSCEPPGWQGVGVAIAVMMIAAILVTPFQPIALVALLAGAIGSLVVRAVTAARLGAVVHAFSQVGPLLAAAAALRAALAPDGGAITEPLVTDLPRVKRLATIAAWAGRDATGAASGNISSLVLEYLNLIFCLDSIALVFGGRLLRRHAAELRRVLHSVGEIDAALSVASFRAGTPGWKRPRFAGPGEPAVLRSLRHPLVPAAVPNSIALGPPRGVLITGSNMSGKTTFLRTLGVNIVLSQTINTCLADVYDAPPFVVRTCIGREDDPSSGKSYYLVELESVLSLVDAARSREAHLILFDELFRGTNTVERIAAGEAVLRYLLTGVPGTPATPHVVIAATHDQELVHLLDGLCVPAYFTDAIDDVGLTFDYRLRDGVSRTRNAIALLRLRGAPAALISRATQLANALDGLDTVQT